MFEDARRRMDHFWEWGNARAVRKPAAPGVRYACPCCGCLTLETRADFEICEVCYWEDEEIDDDVGRPVGGGPNGCLTLAEARANYRSFGACEESMKPHVRPPTKEEMPGH